MYTLIVFSHTSLKLLSVKWVENTTFSGTLSETGASVYWYSHFPVQGECCGNIKQLSLCCDSTLYTGQTGRRGSHAVVSLAKLWAEHK